MMNLDAMTAKGLGVVGLRVDGSDDGVGGEVLIQCVLGNLVSVCIVECVLLALRISGLNLACRYVCAVNTVYTSRYAGNCRAVFCADIACRWKSIV